MKARIIPFLFGVIIFLAFSSCNVLNFTKDYKFDLTYNVIATTTALNESYLMDAVVLIPDFEDYSKKIETIEIISMTCSISAFVGTEEQTFTGGLLRIGSEDGSESEILTALPEGFLHEMMFTEDSLDLDDQGAGLAEELILNDPHKIKGNLTGTFNSTPASFTLKLHVLTRISGSLL
jgi:hypothetical protein